MTELVGGKGQPGVKLPESLNTLRQKLYGKAKNERKFKFYTLYAHIYRPDVLETAWKLVKRNKGAPGVDGVSISDIERMKGGVGEYLGELGQELKERRYKAQSVKRCYIEKPDGGLRPLGIPTVRCRIVQTAVRLVIEPIFEADFEDCSYGFRPGRSQHDALKNVQENLRQGYREVYDIDLKGCFDSIPHDKLMKCVEMRISDGGILKLIKQWLKAATVEDAGGGKKRTSRSDKGTPQGGSLSPLLSNIYLLWFDKVYQQETAKSETQAKLVRFADDMLVMAKELTPVVTTLVQDKLEKWLGLEINQDKTRVVKISDGLGSVDFLGFSFRYDRDLKGRASYYLNTEPSAKCLKRERSKIKVMTSQKRCFVPISELIADINNHLGAWSPYFNFGYPRNAYRKINRYVNQRLTRHLKRRSQRAYRLPEGVTYYSHLKKLGWVPL